MCIVNWKIAEYITADVESMIHIPSKVRFHMIPQERWTNDYSDFLEIWGFWKNGVTYRVKKFTLSENCHPTGRLSVDDGMMEVLGDCFPKISQQDLEKDEIFPCGDQL